MNFEYDSWNRIQEMSYPDGEVVSYSYDKGGMLNSITSSKNGVTHSYMDSIRYNRYGLRDTVFYGNGAWAEYFYDDLLRLCKLKSHTSAFPGESELMQDIVYEYDPVGNITWIYNCADRLLNGMGGQYSNHYVYDNLYRLSVSVGDWYGRYSMSYTVNMAYHPNGRVSSKSVSAQAYEETPSSQNQTSVVFNNSYYYNTNQPNTLAHIGANAQIGFWWDLKGNMTRHYESGENFDRRMCWDEWNRLMGVVDNSFFSCYQYDADGERVCKLVGGLVQQNRNGERSDFYYVDSPTLYASPYLVATPQGYTKHYYADNERIASRIGGGGLQDLDVNNSGTLFQAHVNRAKGLFDGLVTCLDASAFPLEYSLLSLYDWRDSVQPENDCYWYHPDHLGSSSWITYSDGKAVQHLHYLPWGEDFINQRTTDYAARYTFSAKEKDTETGFSYFGSRYYSSDLSIWLSVDPMSDKYPSLSPYVYCANNPVKLVDPNGEEWEIDGYIYTPGGTCPDNVSQSTKDKWNTMNKIYGTREGKTVIDAMNKEGVCYSVSSEKCPSGPAGGEYVSDGNKTGGTIYLNGVNSDVGLLAHEMFHGYQDLNNQGSQTIHNEVQARLFATDIQNQTFSPGMSQLTPERGILPEVFSYNVDKVVSGTYSSQNMQYLEDTFKSHFDGYENVKKRKEGQTDLYGTIKTH